MDPVSITASVVALTRTVFLCARDLQSLHTRFSSSSRIITSISTESKLIGAFLQQLGKLLKNSPRAILERIEDSPELGDALKAALDHCTDIYQQLNKEISYFKENHKKPGQLRFRDKLRYLWNEENLKELHQTLRAQQGIFSSFLQLNSASVRTPPQLKSY
jgi:hypothetical protein